MVCLGWSLQILKITNWRVPQLFYAIPISLTSLLGSKYFATFTNVFLIKLGSIFSKSKK
jgi:hypothetical protein